MTRPTLFFSSTKPLKTKRNLVDLGGAEDAIFRSFVVGVFDNFLKSPKDKTIQRQMVQLIQMHQHYFPGQFTLLQPKSMDNAKEYLLAPQIREKLIDQLAISVKKTVEKRIDPNSEKKGNHHKIYLETLAEIFLCKIHLKISEQGQDLFLRQKYGKTQDGNQVTIRYFFNKNHYLAEVKEDAFFKIRENNFEKRFPFLASLNKRDYEEHLSQLSEFVQSEPQKSKTFLINLYVKHLHLFPLKKEREEESSPQKETFLNTHEALNLNLMKSIAKLLTEGKLSREEVYGLEYAEELTI